MYVNKTHDCVSRTWIKFSEKPSCKTCLLYTSHELELLEFQDGDCRLRVRCSKGTYIRTLCEDIGRALGCGGCMAALRRSRAGVYTLDRAIPLQQLLDRFESCLLYTSMRRGTPHPMPSRATSSASQ